MHPTMTKYLISALILFISINYAATYLINMSISERKSHPGMCYDEDLDVFYGNGTVNQRKGLCEVARCLPDLSIRINGCVEPSGPLFCQIVPVNFELPFPKCCARVKCL
uniref:CSON002891 protein n=1 Tax=Culicoides sonorensis TaxID=179676 RepID=A0A336MPW2_CULSO